MFGAPAVLALLFCFALKALGQAVPQTIHLQSRTLSQGASLRRRALSPTTVPLADFFLGTDLQYVPNLILSILFLTKLFSTVQVVRKYIRSLYLCLKVFPQVLIYPVT